MHVLCIDDDKSFCRTIEEEANSLGVPCTIALSCASVKQKIANFSFSAFILGSKFAADTLIKKEKKISLVYPELPTVSQLKDLKSSQHIGFVGGKPMSSNEAHYLLSKICKIPNAQEPICDWVEEIPEKLMNDYFKLTYERLNLIAVLIKEAKINPSGHIGQELQKIVHKIAGSAGMYGRVMAGEICKKMEVQLKNQDYLNLDLDSFYRQLYLYVQ